MSRKINKEVFNKLVPQLGTMSDPKLAEIYGVSYVTIHRYRKLLDIKSHRETKPNKNPKNKFAQIKTATRKYIEGLNNETEIKQDDKTLCFSYFRNREEMLINTLANHNDTFRELTLSLVLPDDENDDNEFFTDWFYELVEDKEWLLCFLQCILDYFNHES